VASAVGVVRHSLNEQKVTLLLKIALPLPA
jgi:hypothetical protein